MNPLSVKGNTLIYYKNVHSLIDIKYPFCHILCIALFAIAVFFKNTFDLDSTFVQIFKHR